MPYIITHQCFKFYSTKIIFLFDTRLQWKTIMWTTTLRPPTWKDVPLAMEYLNLSEFLLCTFPYLFVSISLSVSVCFSIYLSTRPRCPYTNYITITVVWIKKYWLSFWCTPPWSPILTILSNEQIRDLIFWSISSNFYVICKIKII